MKGYAHCGACTPEPYTWAPLDPNEITALLELHTADSRYP